MCIHHGRQAYGNSEKSVPRVHFLKQNHSRGNFSFFFLPILGPTMRMMSAKKRTISFSTVCTDQTPRV
jgi:hypothetical protein